jgi:hypothetical protein
VERIHENPGDYTPRDVLPSVEVFVRDYSSVIFFSLTNAGFQRFNAFLQFFMLKRLLRERDYALSRSDADVFAGAIQVFQKCVRCPRHAGLHPF